MVGCTKKADWASDYPFLWSVIVDHAGDIMFIDEFNVPIFSKLRYVSIKRKHDLFQKDIDPNVLKRSPALEKLRANFFSKAQEIHANCKSDEMRPMMDTMCITISMKEYLQCIFEGSYGITLCFDDIQ
jgi:hypothetical protein